jgi:C4-dicarboxylate transporter DctM subunit
MTFLVLLAALIGLLYLGMPMFAALFLLPLAVLLYVEGGVPALGEMVIGKLDGYLLVAIPLFMLMAHVMVRGRVVDDLYGAAFALLRRVRGGVGIATVAACTVFAAISGSSVATALTVGKIAIPQMLRYGMSRRGAFGVVAGGGHARHPDPALGADGALRLRHRGLGRRAVPGRRVPGLMMAALFAAWCWLTRAAPARRPTSRRRSAPRGAAPRRLVHLAAGVRAGRHLLRRLHRDGGGGHRHALRHPRRGAGLPRADPADFLDGVAEATRTSSMLLMIIAGAAIYGYMLTKLLVPQELVALVAEWGLTRTGFLVAMMVLLFLLGLVLESFSIILLTMPAILPVMDTLGIDKVWYGILLTLSLEMALISPPVAMNLVVIKAITGAPLSEVNRSIMPYMLMLAWARRC